MPAEDMDLAGQAVSRFGAVEAPDRDHFSNRRFDVSGELFSSLFRDKYLLFRRNTMSAIDREWFYGPWGWSDQPVLPVNETNVKRLFMSNVIEDGLMSSLKGAWNVDAGADSGPQNDNSIEGVAQDLNRVSYMAYVSHIRRLNHVVAGGEAAKQVEPRHVAPFSIGIDIGRSGGRFSGRREDIRPLVGHLLPSRPGFSLVVGYRGDLLLAGDRACLAIELWVGARLCRIRAGPAVRALRGSNIHGVGRPRLGLPVAPTMESVRIAAGAGPNCCPPALVGPGCRTPPRVGRKGAVVLRWTGPADAASPGSARRLPNLREPQRRNVHLALALDQTRRSDGSPPLSPAAGHPCERRTRSLIPVRRPASANTGSWEAAALPMGISGGGRRPRRYRADRRRNGGSGRLARGMFHVTAYKTRQYREEAGDAGPEGVVFANRPPPEAAAGRGGRLEAASAKYDAIDKDGFPIPGKSMYEDDMVMGMVATTIETSIAATGVDKVVGDRVRREVRRDVSDPVARGEEGIVDHVFVTGEPGARHAKVSLRCVRVPELGDKMASRYAQKGVVGMMLPACDMPFCHVSGMVPDIVFNPNAFPKRMTVAHLLEALLGKTAVMSGNRVRADTFEPSGVPEAAELLETRYGMNRMGDEILYNGRTGEQMGCEIFVGINYVGRLKHLVVDKMNFRATGPVAAITHQATKGRKDKGGLRIGEMEQAAIMAHGAASTLKESFMERADGAINAGVDTGAFDVDARNGKPCTVSNGRAGVFRCVDAEKGNRATARVRVPYAAKLLLQELNALSIDDMAADPDTYMDDATMNVR
ncbi:MAG: hypothetical protein WDW38_006558 [Sanguina aurantia]